METIDIDALLQVGERIVFECKKAEDSIPKSIWETYSAFANTVGGIILLGISENLKEPDIDKRFEITGVRNASKMKKELFDTLNSDKVNRNILGDADVEEISFQGHTLLCIKIPQADYRQRPIYINGNIMKGSFKRNYEGDYHCTEEDVKAMIRDANDSGNDGILMENYTMDDIDKNTLNAYRNRFRTANQDHVWNDYDDKEFLLNMGGYVVDRNTHREGLTLAGLLMFGKGLPVRERFDNIRMDYLDMTNLQDGSRWSDRLTYDGRWENNLYNFFTRVQAKLVSDLKRPFQLEGMSRIDDTPVHKAVREALTNLIIHSDYMITGVLRIEKRNDCFFFSNPGLLKLPVMDIYAGGHSKARNPNMQAMLRMIGFGDNIGSGFPAILSAWKKENWRKPILKENTDLHIVELTLSMESFIAPECHQKLNAIYGGEYARLDKEEQLILAIAMTEGTVSNYTTQLLLDKNPLEAGKLLYALVDKRMLLSTNRGRWTTYSVNYNFNQGVESRSKSQGVENGQSVDNQEVSTKKKIQNAVLDNKSQGVESRSKSQGVKNGQSVDSQDVDAKRKVQGSVPNNKSQGVEPRSKSQGVENGQSVDNQEVSTKKEVYGAVSNNKSQGVEPRSKSQGVKNGQSVDSQEIGTKKIIQNAVPNNKSQGVEPRGKSQGVENGQSVDNQEINAKKKVQDSIPNNKSQGVESRSKSQGVEMIVRKIAAYCREPRTLQEIADYMGYSDKYRMKKVYIDPYLGKLFKMSASKSKNSPKQKYVTIDNVSKIG